MSSLKAAELCCFLNGMDLTRRRHGETAQHHLHRMRDYLRSTAHWFPQTPQQAPAQGSCGRDKQEILKSGIERARVARCLAEILLGDFCEATYPPIDIALFSTPGTPVDGLHSSPSRAPLANPGTPAATAMVAAVTQVLQAPLVPIRPSPSGQALSTAATQKKTFVKVSVGEEKVPGCGHPFLSFTFIYNANLIMLSLRKLAISIQSIFSRRFLEFLL